MSRIVAKGIDQTTINQDPCLWRLWWQRLKLIAWSKKMMAKVQSCKKKKEEESTKSCNFQKVTLCRTRSLSIYPLLFVALAYQLVWAPSFTSLVWISSLLRVIRYAMKLLHTTAPAFALLPSPVWSSLLSLPSSSLLLVAHKDLCEVVAARIKFSVHLQPFHLILEVKHFQFVIIVVFHSKRRREEAMKCKKKKEWDDRLIDDEDYLTKIVNPLKKYRTGLQASIRLDNTLGKR